MHEVSETQPSPRPLAPSAPTSMALVHVFTSSLLHSFTSPLPTVHFLCVPNHIGAQNPPKTTLNLMKAENLTVFYFCTAGVI